MYVPFHCIIVVLSPVLDCVRIVGEEGAGFFALLWFVA